MNTNRNNENFNKGFSKDEKENKINYLLGERRQIEEAIELGEEANKSLLKLIKTLNSARNWGVWDIFGGKSLVNLGKHSAIKKANRMTGDIVRKLEKFKRKLNHVNEFTDIKVDLSGFATFADFFFDGFFADFFVQGKIKDAIKNTKKVNKNVDEILYRLKNDLSEIDNLLRKLRNEN